MNEETVTYEVEVSQISDEQLGPVPTEAEMARAILYGLTHMGFQDLNSIHVMRL